MISICIALVALLCIVSCFFSVGILCNYLQVVLARLLTNIDNYILSHNVYVLLLLMFGEALEGQRPYLSSTLKLGISKFYNFVAENIAFVCSVEIQRSLVRLLRCVKLCNNPCCVCAIEKLHSFHN